MERTRPYSIFLPEDLAAPRDKAVVIRDIQQTVPFGASRPTDGAIIRRLTGLTNELIAVSGGRGTLRQNNPYAEVLEREYPVEPSVAEALKGKRILITGGEGLVGQRLVRQLAEDFAPASIASIDIAGREGLYGERDSRVTYHNGDIRNPQGLRQVFEAEHPDIVFHLAALSEVGVGEAQKAATIDTNIFGTKNIIALSEEFGVDACIYSSTGKSAQYVTSGIFGATVKIAEGELAAAAQNPESTVRYGMARFTHVVENSNLVDDIRDGIDDGLVFLHRPDRYFFAQGVDEASTNLLNSLIVAERGKFKFGSVREIGWPVNNLDIALHEIAKSDNSVGIYFAGVEKGYDPETFNGQRDWSIDDEVPPALVNVLETQKLTTSPSGGTFVTELAPFSVDALHYHVDQLQDALTGTQPTDTTLQETLTNAVKAMTSSEFDQTNPELLIKILKWGSMSEDLHIHKDTFDLLVRSLRGRVTPEMLQKRVKRGIPIETTVARLHTIVHDEDIAFLTAA
jgi:hypothetical protein